MEGSVGVGLITFALFVLVICLAASSTATEFKNKHRRKFVNNAIADLIEKGSVLYLADTDETGEETHFVVRGAKSPSTQITQRVLFHGMGTSNRVTAKEFHAGVYEARHKINDYITKVGIAIPEDLPTPKDRMENGNESLMTLLPLLILGDTQGNGTSDSSPVYIGDSDYSGYSDSSGGDSGGGDGGGGGGGD